MKRLAERFAWWLMGHTAARLDTRLGRAAYRLNTRIYDWLER